MSHTKISTDYPTCDCWTPKCGYCTSLSCTVRYNLFNSSSGIQVHSTPIRRKRIFDTIIFYDEDGHTIGKFQWNNKNGIFLSGCVGCRTPSALRKARLKGGISESWTLSLFGGVVRVVMQGEVMYENSLKGECLDRYSKAKRFSFYSTPCDNTFSLRPSEMEAGELITDNCASACSDK